MKSNNTSRSTPPSPAYPMRWEEWISYLWVHQRERVIAQAKGPVSDTGSSKPALPKPETARLFGAS